MNAVLGLPSPLTREAEELTRAWHVFLVVALAVAVVVYGLLAFALLRYRRRDDRLPLQVHTRIRIEIAYTLVPAVIVAALVGVTIEAVADTTPISDRPDVIVDVVGAQWTWRFDYEGGPGGDGARDDVPELVLPVSSTVRFNVTSDDVIHSFWVPGFLYKRDLIPGEVQTFEVTTGETTGTFEGRCAEFCGLGHAGMRFTVRIVTDAEYASWWAGR